MPTMDQVAWAGANVLVGNARESFTRGSLLPEPITQEEAYDRQTLRLIGAVRVVEVVYTPDELAAQMQLQGEATARREAAGHVDPAAPLGAQTEQQAEPGPPTVVGPGGSPVVIGDDDLRAEHEQARGKAQQRRDKAAAERDQAAGEQAGQPARGMQPTVAQPEAPPEAQARAGEQVSEQAGEGEPPPGRPRRK